MSNRVSTKRTPGPTSRLPSMPSSNKKKPRRSFGRANATRPSKNFQEGVPLRSGTAVASGSASSPAKAVQSVIPKSAKGIHAELGSQGNGHATRPPTSNAVYAVQLNATALRFEDLEEQTLGLSKKIASMSNIVPFKERTQINWLSPLVGATIIPELCSPPSPPKELKFEYSNLEKPEDLTNQETSKSHGNDWYSRWLGIKSQFPINSGLSAPGPATALLPWKEAERRYCVPEGQVLQLGVSSPRYILPTCLIIEHWRKGEVPGSLMRGAPKDVELWTYIGVEDDAAKVRDEALASYPGLTANYSQQNESLRPEQILDFPWVPIGVFRYEINMARNVQEFLIGYDLEIPMARFAIRVISNWGHVSETCLVRVRLYGEVMDGEKEVI